MNKAIILTSLFFICFVRAETWNFECCVTGKGLTVWNGNVFDCPNAQNEIVLLHSRYNSSEGDRGVNCNNEDSEVMITGEIIGVSDNIYTSRITITSKLNLTGESIECSYDNGSTSERVMRYVIVLDAVTTTQLITTQLITTENGNERNSQSTLVIIAIASGAPFCMFIIGITIILFVYFLRRKRRKQPNVKRDAAETYNNGINSDQQTTSTTNYAFIQPVTVSSDQGVRVQANEESVIIVTEGNYSYLDFAGSENPDLKPLSETREMKARSGCIREEDELLNLDTLLIKLHGKVNDRWFQFGQAIGVPLAFLKKLEGYPQEDCMVEIVDYWLRNHPDQPTWKEIADAIEDIQDYELAKSIKGVYELAMPLLDVDDCETRNL